MLRSNASMNSAGSELARALDMEPKTCRISECVSAWIRADPKSSATAKIRATCLWGAGSQPAAGPRPAQLGIALPAAGRGGLRGHRRARPCPPNGSALRTVARIDFNVLLGEIAGSETRPSAAGAAKRELHQTFGFVQAALQVGLTEIRGDAAFADAGLLEADVGLGRIEIDAGIARGGKNPAPVRVGPGNGGFEQGRVGDCPSNALGGGIVGRAAHVDEDELAGALAIADDLLGEALEHGGERTLERITVLVRHLHAGSAVRHQQRVSLVEVSPSTEIRL